MKKHVVKSVIALMTIALFSSCSDCKKCSASLMGTQVGETKKLCGDDLKIAMEAGLNCQ